MESNNEREIDLVNMLYRILKHWRILVTFMLIGALTLNIYSVIKDKKNVSKTRELIENYNNSISSQTENSIIDYSYYTNNLNESQISEVDNLFVTYKVYQGPYSGAINYANNSIFMQIDSNAVPTYTLQYIIDTHYTTESTISRKDYTEDIQISTMNILLDDDFLNDMSTSLLSDGIELKPSYIPELISSSFNMDVFSISIYGRNKTECEAIMNLVKNQLPIVFSNLESTYGDFDYTLFSESYTESYNPDILEAQKNIAATLYDTTCYANGLVSSLSDDQKSYFYALVYNDSNLSITPPINDSSSKKSVTPSTITIPTVKMLNIKYIIFGMLLGFFMFSAWIAIYSLFCGKILTSNDIEIILGAPQIGEWKDNKLPKGLFSFVDKWIINLFDRKDKSSSPEERLEIIATEVRILAQKNDWRNIIISSSANDSITQSTISNLSDILQNTLKPILCEKPIVNSPESLEVLNNADAVVLVETIDISKINEIKKEYKLCKKYNVPILGYVTIKI